MLYLQKLIAGVLLALDFVCFCFEVSWCIFLYLSTVTFIRCDDIPECYNLCTLICVTHVRVVDAPHASHRYRKYIRSQDLPTKMFHLSLSQKNIWWCDNRQFAYCHVPPLFFITTRPYVSGASSVKVPPCFYVVKARYALLGKFMKTTSFFIFCHRRNVNNPLYYHVYCNSVV